MRCRASVLQILGEVAGGCRGRVRVEGGEQHPARLTGHRSSRWPCQAVRCRWPTTVLPVRHHPATLHRTVPCAITNCAGWGAENTLHCSRRRRGMASEHSSFGDHGGSGRWLRVLQKCGPRSLGVDVGRPLPLELLRSPPDRLHRPGENERQSTQSWGAIDSTVPRASSFPNGPYGCAGEASGTRAPSSRRAARLEEPVCPLLSPRAGLRHWQPSGPSPLWVRSLGGKPGAGLPAFCFWPPPFRALHNPHTCRSQPGARLRDKVRDGPMVGVGRAYSNLEQDIRVALLRCA